MRSKNSRSINFFKFNIKRIHASIIILAWIPFFSFSQQSSEKGDYIWVMGRKEDLINYKGYFKIDFNTDPITLDTMERVLSMGISNNSFSNIEGRLLMYSNGISIGDSSLQVMNGGDSISSKSTFIQSFPSYYVTGYPGLKSSFFIPSPIENLYYYFYTLLEYDLFYGVYEKYLARSTIEYSINFPFGKVIEKQKIILTDTLSPISLSACRHANGRDWWMIIQRNNSKLFSTYLIDPLGFHLIKQEVIDVPLTDIYGAPSIYSPDGRKYCHMFDQFGIQVFDFDRCTGTLSNFKWIPLKLDAPVGDIAISPNSRFLYAFTGSFAIQYDLFATTENDLILSADTIGYYDYVNYPIQNIGISKLGPNGKIYISSTMGGDVFAVINNPDKKSKAASFKLRGLQLPFVNYPGSMPNFQNYRLGPLDGSSCDTLGLDNMPKAKFRVDIDSFNYLTKSFVDLSYYEPVTWTWDFGDGTMSSDTSPIHTYQNDGEYHVCLTVTNINGSNSYCRDIGVWTVSTSEPENKNTLFRFYPNPVHDMLHISLEEDSKSRISIYNIMGVRVFTKDFTGKSPIDINVSGLTPGLYFLKVALRDNIHNYFEVKKFQKF